MAFLHIEYLILEDLRGHLIFFIKLQKKENAMADTDFRPGRLGTYSLQFKSAGGQNFFGPFNVFPVGYYVKKSHELTQTQNQLLNINEEKKICLCYKFRDQNDAIYSSPLFNFCDTKEEYGYEPNSRTKIITKLPVIVAAAAISKGGNTIRNLMSECLNDFTFLLNDKNPTPYKKLRKRQESYLYTENDESDVILKHVLRNHYFIPENMMANYLPFFKKKLKTKGTYEDFSKKFFENEKVKRGAFELIDANECVKLMVNLKNAKEEDENYIECEGMLFPNPNTKQPKKRKRNKGKKNDTSGSSSKKQKKVVSQDSVEEEQRKKDDVVSDGEDFPDIELFMSDGKDFPDTVSAKESLVEAMQRLLNSFSDSDDE